MQLGAVLFSLSYQFLHRPFPQQSKPEQDAIKKTRRNIISTITLLQVQLKIRRGRGRLKLTWEEAIKRDLKGWDIPRDLCLDMSAWKTAIDMPEP